MDGHYGMSDRESFPMDGHYGISKCDVIGSRQADDGFPSTGTAVKHTLPLTASSDVDSSSRKLDRRHLRSSSQVKSSAVGPSPDLNGGIDILVLGFPGCFPFESLSLL